MTGCWFRPLVILKSVKCDGLHLQMLECATLENKQAIKCSPWDCAVCESMSLYLSFFPLSKQSASRSQDTCLLKKKKRNKKPDIYWYLNLCLLFFYLIKYFSLDFSNKFLVNFLVVCVVWHTNFYQSLSEQNIPYFIYSSITESNFFKIPYLGCLQKQKSLGEEMKQTEI